MMDAKLDVTLPLAAQAFPDLGNAWTALGCRGYHLYEDNTRQNNTFLMIGQHWKQHGYLLDDG
jgi:quinol monooxygenase YgiN